MSVSRNFIGLTFSECLRTKFLSEVLNMELQSLNGNIEYPN